MDIGLRRFLEHKFPNHSLEIIFSLEHSVIDDVNDAVRVALGVSMDEARKMMDDQEVYRGKKHPKEVKRSESHQTKSTAD